jgi:hypothetical protein
MFCQILEIQIIFQLKMKSFRNLKKTINIRNIIICIHILIMPINNFFQISKLETFLKTKTKMKMTNFFKMNKTWLTLKDKS